MHYIQITVILVYTMVIILDTRAGCTGDNSLTDCGSDGRGGLNAESDNGGSLNA